MRKAFVVVQVALSLMLLVGAGLFLRTLQNAYAVDLGFRLGNTLLTGVNLDVRGYTPEAGQVVYERILERARALPGVVAVSAARVSVLFGNARSGVISTNGQPYLRAVGNGITVRSNVVADRYLEAMGIPSVARPCRRARRHAERTAGDDWVLDGLRLVAIGTALGLAGAVAAVRLIEAQLFGVAPTDLATFTAVATLLLVIGALACAIPALRAMRLDPVVVLRS